MSTINPSATRGSIENIEPTKELVQEEAVCERYARAAQSIEPELCCPVTYDRRYLDAIPQPVLDCDYGCGDPTPFVHSGDTVLDLGSGAGKICFIAGQIVGPMGRVIGVDCNAEMLQLARSHQAEVARRIGFANVEFRCGVIQDLRLDLDQLGIELGRSAVQDQQTWLKLRSLEERIRHDSPLVDDESVDCVLSNCVLNLVRPGDREQLFDEMFRVVRRGGRVAVSDIVADEDVPSSLQRDPKLWSGCIAGAFREDVLLQAFEEAGFHGIQIVKRSESPWRVVEGIEFRSVTLLAYKGKQGPCLERNQALIYRGPFKSVEDDDGHRFSRGERIAVCEKTFQLLQREPYAGQFELVPPFEEVPIEAAHEYDCRRSRKRHPRETKGIDYTLTTESTSDCNCDGPCC